MRSTRYRLPLIPLWLKRNAYNLLKPADAHFIRNLVDAQNGLIYLHIPKTGGNSVQKSMQLRKTGHKPLRLFQLALPAAHYQNAFKFTFVRDPWTRLASAFHYLKTDRCSIEDKKWAAANLAAFNTFRQFVLEWVERKTVYQYIHFIPQVEFVRDWSGKVDIEFVGKLDQIRSDYARLNKILGRDPGDEITHANRTEGAVEYLRMYDSDMIEVVADAYWEDIKQFGFSTPG